MEPDQYIYMTRDLGSPPPVRGAGDADRPRRPPDRRRAHDVPAADDLLRAFGAWSPPAGSTTRPTRWSARAGSRSTRPRTARRPARSPPRRCSPTTTGSSRPTATPPPSVARGVDPVEVLVLLKGDWHSGYDPYEHKVAPQATPLATQLPHAVGVAHAARLRGEDTVVMAMCGDGATSEGDFHEALNFAAVFNAPVVFFVQNNEYAISVPLARQSRRAVAGAQGRRLRRPRASGSTATTWPRCWPSSAPRSSARAGRRGPAAGRGAHLPDAGAHQRRRRHPLPPGRRGRGLGGEGPDHPAGDLPARRRAARPTSSRRVHRRGRPSWPPAHARRAQPRRRARTPTTCSPTCTPQPTRSCVEQAGDASPTS